MTDQDTRRDESLLENIPAMIEAITENTNSLKRKRTTTIQPRWYNQAYLLFLALRQTPTHSLPRLKLIDAAIELDKLYSKELQLPRVFRGKTPKNSASASLTLNSDRYFISFKPEGSRSTHFKLSYEPGNVEAAVTEYQKWCTKLVEHDWPYCFGVPKEEEERHYHTPISHPDDSLEAITEKKEGLTAEESKLAVDKTESVEPADETETCELVESGQTVNGSIESVSETKENILATEIEENVSTETNSDSLSEETKVEREINEMSQQLSSQVTVSTPISSPPATVSLQESVSAPLPPSVNPKKKQPTPPEPFISLEKLDLSNIPQSWQDIVYVAPSKIPGGGNGLFAKRKLPYNTPIGFYFGIPMTEDEFDSLKDRVGRSSEYSIMYRRTVLDATDEAGQPICDPTLPRYCPFHFMNETSSQKEASVAFVEGAIVNQIICWTKKVIEQDEELFVWYGTDVHRYWTEEEEEANKAKQKKKVKTTLKKESKRAKVLQERKEKAEFAKVQKLQEEELKKYELTWIDETQLVMEEAQKR